MVQPASRALRFVRGKHRSLASLRVAIVHDWLVVYAGAERVLEQMLEVFPQADLFTMVDFLPAGERGFIRNKSVSTSFVQKLPFARRMYRHYLPLMPLAVEQFDLSSYDLVISSSAAVAKGVITGPDQLHVCMCYSPMRYAWDLTHHYLRESNLISGPKSWLARWMLHKLRLWDVRTANGVDEFIAISHFISRRIQKVYRRESTVIYPPVDTSAFDMGTERGDFYLTASRLVPYKRIDQIVEAFAQMPDKKLIVIGDGPEMRKIRDTAAPNVTLLGYQSHSVLKDHLQRAKAFVFAAEEDFGIAPLEAMACGTPVIAYGRGGARETIADGVAGLHFHEQTAQSIRAAVGRFEAISHQFDPKKVRGAALRFGPERFRKEFQSFVAEAYNRHQSKIYSPIRSATLAGSAQSGMTAREQREAVRS